MADTGTLNLSDGEIKLAGSLLTELLRGYERTAPSGRVMPRIDRGVLEGLLRDPFPAAGAGIEGLFREIQETVLPNSTAIAHPRFLAYVLGPANGIAPFADAVASALNQNCNFWQLSPAASVIEQSVIGWLAGLFGYPGGSGGIVTSGGSMANLMAIATALRHRCGDEFAKQGLQSVESPLVLYTSAEAHRCVEKAAVILGLGLANVRKIPVDSSFMMRADLLEAAVREDRAVGKTPFCVVATAGTVNTGAIDPIGPIADLCGREDLWLHVDGAYGALFALGRETRDVLLPCGRADSIALDPHKLLFIPLEAGCLLVRRQETLRQAFSFSASYLSADQDPLFVNYMDYGPQLSRSFKAFKVWCSLRAFGVLAFREAVERMVRLARYMERRILEEARLELLAPVPLSAVCFRIRGAGDGENRHVLEDLVREGTALLGPVSINGQFGIRACITNYRTTEADIDLVLERLLSLAGRFRNDG
ncbi:MAG: pyridoxal-dependent decarboxylase [Spirochaetes bacterium]|nr:pyridoxal-dependent decarboxylase [Spirochaetota bacterium]